MPDVIHERPLYLLKNFLKDWEKNRLEVGDGFGSRCAHNPNGQTQRLKLELQQKKNIKYSYDLKYQTTLVQWGL